MVMVVHRFRQVELFGAHIAASICERSKGEPMRDSTASLLAFSFGASEGGFCRHF